jgi:hypothetical protein
VFQLAKVAALTAVRRDPAPDRSAQGPTAASGKSIRSSDRRQPDGRGAAMIDRELPKARQNGAHEPYLNNGCAQPVPTQQQSFPEMP